MRDIDTINTFTEYQIEQVRTAVEQEETHWRLAVAGLGIAGEAGEVADLIKKIVAHGHSLPGCLDQLEKELGDVQWYISEVCSALDIPLSRIARKNIAKLRERYPDGFDPQCSQVRRLGDL